jgi:hypothetical protein
METVFYGIFARESQNGVRTLNAILPFDGLLVEEHFHVLPDIENTVR